MNKKTLITMKKTLLTLLVTLILGASYAQKNVLVEELTGTWCQWCPRGIYYGDSLCNTYDNVIFVAIHCSDPMANEGYYQASGLLGAPSANIGRRFLSLDTQNWFQKVADESQIPAKVGMGINCNYDLESRQLTVSVVATALENMSGNYRFAAILTEDGVTGPAPSYNQSNSYSGGAYGPMGGFESLPNPVPANRMAYDHVGRQLLCDYDGAENSFPASLSSGQSANYEFVSTLDEGWDYNYVRIIGLLIAPDGTIENAVRSPYLNGDETAAPLFTSAPNTEAYANLNYLYNVYFHDPDDAYVNISLQGPDWLTLEQYDGQSAALFGIPAQPGEYEVTLVLSDCLHSTTQSFTIVVNEPLNGAWEYVGPRCFSQDALQTFGIAIDPEGSLYVFGKQGNAPALYKNASGSDSWEQMGNINTSCSVSQGGLAVASNGDVYVAYSENNMNDTGHVMKWDGTQWTSVGSDFCSVETHIYLDHNETPYLLARDVSQNYIGVVYKLENNVWTPLSGTGIYAPSNEYACHQDLVFDSNNTPIISYGDYMAGNALKVRKFENGEWVLVGNAISNIYYYQSLSIDENDNLWIAYCESGSQHLQAARFNGNDWENIGENLSGGVVSDISSCMNGERFTIAFVNDAESNYLSVMEFDDSWSNVGPTLVSEGASDDPCILAVDGKLYVTYSDDGLDGRASCMRYAQAAILYPPTDFAAEVFGNDNVSLTWGLPVEGSPTAYKLYRDDALLATVGELQYTDYDLPSGTHRYTLSAVYPEGESVQVGPIVVETTVGIGDDEALFCVYPTVASSTLSIESQMQGNAVVHNALGQRVMEAQVQIGTTTIDVSALPNGVYYLRMAGHQTVKIVKD